MVKLAGPCMSMGASGKLAGAIVFSNWKGRPYARRLVIPANPKSGGQTGVRAMFKFLSQNWAGMSAGEKSDWDTRADQTTISPFNAFMAYNMDRWRNYLGPSQLDPATEEAPQHGLANITSTAGVKQITLSADSDGAGDPWAIIWHRSATAIFTPSGANVIAVQLCEAADTYEYVDTPLAAGTWYYNQAVINASGRRTDADFEHSAIVA